MNTVTDITTRKTDKKTSKGGVNSLREIALVKTARGFTIIELIVVLVIMVGAVSLVGPNFLRGLDSLRLKSATRDVASALRYSRTTAIFSADQSEFQLNVENNVYRVTGKEKAYTVPESIRLKLVTAESETTNDQEGIIRFYPDGSSTGGRVTLEVDQRKRHIDVNWLTGQVITRIEN